MDVAATLTAASSVNERLRIPTIPSPYSERRRHLIPSEGAT